MDTPELWLMLTCLMFLAVWLGYEVVTAWLRSWQRRLRRIEAGRRRQAAEWQDRQDAERRAAAERISRNCFWTQP
jgi:hypothetical protein